MVYLCDFELQSNLDSSNFEARTQYSNYEDFLLKFSSKIDKNFTCKNIVQELIFFQF